jgi:leader peptidase (prepilin peptidase)/N-methyltransferase
MPALTLSLWALLGAGLAAALGPAAHRWAHTAEPTIQIRIASAAVTGALFAGLISRLGPRPELLAFSWLAVVGAQLATTDLSALRLPNRLILPSYPAMTALLGVAAGVEHNAGPLLRALAGMLVLLAAFGGLYLLVSGGQIAAGDLKLSGLLGLALGWYGWTALLTGTLLGWLFAAIGHLVRRAVGLGSRDTPVPLGAFLIAGTFTALLGSPIT